MRRYSDIPLTMAPEGEKMYRTTRYPDIPRDFSDVYVYTTIGDRYDILAQQYYGDSSLWWIISRANSNLIQNSLTPPVGTQIRIPTQISSILKKFAQINN